MVPPFATSELTPTLEPISSGPSGPSSLGAIPALQPRGELGDAVLLRRDAGERHPQPGCLQRAKAPGPAPSWPSCGLQRLGDMGVAQNERIRNQRDSREAKGITGGVGG